jgi:GT2 family glycosyltransferase
MKLNGFDQQFFMYSEDVDICYRLIKLGYSLYGINNVKMFHYLGAISEKKENKFFSVIMQKESRYRYIIKHSGKIHACLYRFLWLLAGFLRSTLAFIIFLLVMFYKSKELGIKRILIKHLKIVSWALYLESWVNPLYDDGR